MKLNAQELRLLEEEKAEKQLQEIKRNPIFFILENVYDTYNIGGLFRLADALAIEKIYLCGEMETPPNHRIKKASIGTYKIVPWAYKKTAKEAVDEVRSAKLEVRGEKLPTSNIQPLTVIAIEQDKRSVPYTQINYQTPLALILGNETYGVKPETLALADQIAEIPMWGINKSLNVIVSAAIVSYRAVTACLTEAVKQRPIG